MGKSFTDVILPGHENVIRLILTQVRDGGGPVYLSPQMHSTIIPAPLADGSLRIQQATVMPLRNGAGDGKDLLLVVNDVTHIVGQVKAYRSMRDRALKELQDRERAEYALLLANKKLNLLSSITRHDILNQLTGILGALDVIASVPDSTTSGRMLDRIRECVHSVQKQILFTREYQEVGVTAPQWQVVGDLILNAWTQLNHPGVTVERNVGDLSVYADPMLSRVFYNLMENSIRHGERVTYMRFSTRTVPGFLRLVYEDNGIGVPTEFKEMIFRREHFRNTGVGLFLSREILGITGISVTENGVPGEGVRFEILLPDGTYRDAPPSQAG